ncbi:MAG: ParB/RepB/Spo0J family partition protein [Acidobacteriaceae bacterium]|jgi:ParB family chromosome partitioning protein|nr:ParB/RepB/Spo0J family partition protein [Acidobacteriaceae bacterium]
MEKRPALGKGLSALIPDAPPQPVAPAIPTDVEISRLVPNVYQPRGQMDDARLEDLAQSIRTNGVIQPIVVRKEGDRFHIIAGERRWRAAQRAGLTRVPIVVRDVATGTERSLLEMALIENIQRENLNPIDEALAYKRLATEFQMTQDEIATAVGKERATVANVVRLLKLPAEIQAEVASGALSMGHARALLALSSEDEQRRLAREVIANGLSVRATEALVRESSEPAPAAEPGRETENVEPKADVHTRAAEERLKLLYGTRVRIVRRGKKGRIEFNFTSEDELIRIYDQLTDGR